MRWWQTFGLAFHLHRVISEAKKSSLMLMLDHFHWEFISDVNSTVLSSSKTKLWECWSSKIIVKKSELKTTSPSASLFILKYRGVKLYKECQIGTRQPLKSHCGGTYHNYSLTLQRTNRRWKKQWKHNLWLFVLSKCSVWSDCANWRGFPHAEWCQKTKTNFIIMSLSCYS